MVLEILFVISGVIVATILWAKMREDKHKRKPALLRLISRGDERARLWSHEIAHRYSEWKDEAEFFINKEMPFKVRNFVHKTNTVIKERAERHIGDIRGSKFLKRSDGLNEFFKNLSEKENGGRIDESLPEETQEEK